MTGCAKPVTAVILDPCVTGRSVASRLMDGQEGIVVIRSTGSAEIAGRRIRVDAPDVLLLDFEMPQDSLTPVFESMSTHHPGLGVVGWAHRPTSSEAVSLARRLGTDEVLPKAVMASGSASGTYGARMAAALRRAARDDGPPKCAADRFAPLRRYRTDVILPVPEQGPKTGGAPKLIVVGASTGGTEALMRLLGALPDTMPPIAIVQHMPKAFTTAFAARLDAGCRLRVIEACDGARIDMGTVVLADGSRHMLLCRDAGVYRVQVHDGPPVARHKPSVDVLFRSAAGAAGANAFGVVLTGMGDDGCEGLLDMRRLGAETVVQDEASSVVFGMPQAALTCGAADRALPLDRIAPELERFARASGPIG